MIALPKYARRYAQRCAAQRDGFGVASYIDIWVGSGQQIHKNRSVARFDFALLLDFITRLRGIM